MSDTLIPNGLSQLKTWWWSIDRVSLFCLLGIALFGVIMVGTASPSVATRIGIPAYHFLMNHLVFMTGAFVVLIGATFMQARYIWIMAIMLFIGSWFAVIITLVSGMEIKGATRWIHLFGFSVQPSEFLKPAFIILSALAFAKQKQNRDFPGVLIAFLLYAVTVSVLILQPDFGMTFLLTMVFAVQIFLVGCPLRYVVMMTGIMIVGVVIAYTSLSHVQARIDGFLYPESRDSFQIDRSLEAFQSGGLIGTGLGQGTVKTKLPDVHADFIFSAIGEEWGFVFTSLLVIVYAFLFIRFLKRFAASESYFIMLAGSGLTFMLVLQCIIHMGSALRLLPAKGMTLPFISYGGSSLLAVGLSFGLIIALSRGISNSRRRGGWRHLVKKDL
jgi:cell division protein FtsW